MDKVKAELAKTKTDCAKKVGENKCLKSEADSLMEEIRSLKNQLAYVRDQIDSLKTEQERTEEESNELVGKKIEMGSGFRGYAYRYELWMDDEIMGRYVPPERSASKVFFFEFRTKFVVASDPCDSECWGSERFHSSCSNYGCLFTETNVRLCDEYQMTKGEAQSLCLSATDFAKKMETEHPHLAIIPVVVDIEVRTVQQAGESILDTYVRSITPESLLPVYITQGVKTGLTRYLLEMPKIRVESWTHAFDVMNVCLLCMTSSGVGDRISFLRCKHAFHTHCAVNWLLYNNECPYCNAEEHNFLGGSESESTIVLRQESRLIEVQKREKGHTFPQNEGRESEISMLFGEEKSLMAEVEIRKMQGSYIRYIGKVKTELAKIKDDCEKTAGENKRLKIETDSLKEEIYSLKCELIDARHETNSLKSQMDFSRAWREWQI